MDRPNLWTIVDPFPQSSPYPFWSYSNEKILKKLSRTDGQRVNLSSLLPKPMEWNSMSFRIVTVCSSLAVAPTSATRSWEILAPFDSSHFRKACTDLGIKRIFCEFLSFMFAPIASIGFKWCRDLLRSSMLAGWPGMADMILQCIHTYMTSLRSLFLVTVDAPSSYPQEICGSSSR